MRFRINHDDPKKAREFLTSVPSETERQQTERATGTYFSPDATRAEALTAKLHMLAATGDAEAGELLQQWQDFAARLQAETEAPTDEECEAEAEKSVDMDDGT